MACADAIDQAGAISIGNAAIVQADQPTGPDCAVAIDYAGAISVGDAAMVNPNQPADIAGAADCACIIGVADAAAIIVPTDQTAFSANRASVVSVGDAATIEANQPANISVATHRASAVGVGDAADVIADQATDR